MTYPKHESASVPEVPRTRGRRALFPPVWLWLGLALVVLGTGTFLVLTPGGVLTKADYIGAAVCHRMPSHSFFIAEHQLPLCQRCTGTFPGALTGLLLHWVLWRRRRSQAFPPWPTWIVFLGFAGLWGLDGVNSYTWELFGHVKGILGYAPQPWLRLVTGVLMGGAMSAILVPAFNQTMWVDGENSRSLRSWHELALLVVVELALAYVITLLSPWLLYPVTLYSAAGVLAMFITLGALIFVMLLRRDQAFTAWRELGVPLLWGSVFALLIIGAMNVLRFVVVGTIEGVPGLS